jgi:hypothetical protein
MAGMEWLTPREATLWIRKHGQVEAPHHDSFMNPPEHHTQFYAPREYGETESFVRQFLEEIVVEGDVLIQLADSMPFTPAGEYFMGHLWKLEDGETCPSDGSGCVLHSDEFGAATGLFSLTSCLHWQAYLYGARDQIVLFNWEGAIWDTWTSSASKAQEILKLVEEYEFKFVPEEE